MQVDHGSLDVVEVAQKTYAPYHVLNPVDLDRLRTHVEVRPTHGGINLLECETVGTKGIRIYFNLVLLNKTTDGRDFANPIGCGQRIADMPILSRP